MIGEEHNMEMQLVAKAGLMKALSGLYSSVEDEVAELVINGLDAATLAGHPPVIKIRFWAPGEHPLSPNGPALSVLDNGTGFTPEVIRRYCQLGESAWLGNQRGIHGRHGIGKLAAMALGLGTYIIITRADPTQGIAMVQLNMDSLHTPTRWKKLKQERPGFEYLPKEGTFTEIFIPNFRGGTTAPKLQSQLTLRLPISPWEVTVNGQHVLHRQFTAQLKFTSEHVHVLDGPIQLELGILDTEAADDAVWLVDKELGRLVCRLESIRRAAGLRGALCDPRLVGSISVSGLAAFSTPDRDGLQASFWSNQKGEALRNALMLWGNQEATKLLGEEPGTNDGVMELIQKHLGLFATAFGAPALLQGTTTPKQLGSRPHGKRESSEGDTATSRRERTPREQHPPQASTKPRIRIAERDYEVWTFTILSELPAEVRRGDVIVVNLGHPEVKRLMSRRHAAPLTFRDGMVRWLIEAHVIATAEKNQEPSRTCAEIYSLYNRVIPK